MNFDEEIAKELGVECAILLSNIQFWVKKNKANAEDRHFHDDKWWTYNTAGSFAKLFPWWKERTVHNYLDKLEKAGYILSSNFNKFKYDRTKWYTTDGCKSPYNSHRQNLQMDLPKFANASAKIANASTEICRPIPDITTDKKQEDINSYTYNNWQAVVLYFYSKISPTTSLKFKKKVTRESAELLLSIHSEEYIKSKIDWLATSDQRRWCTTFETFCNKFTSFEIQKPKVQPTIMAGFKTPTESNPYEADCPY